MFENRDDSYLDLFSSYITPIIAFGISALAFILLLLNSESLLGYLDVKDMQRARILVNVAGIIIVFLLFNTSYYALISYRRIRMLVMSTMFLASGLILLTGLVNGHQNTADIAELLRSELVTRSFPRLILACGVLAGALLIQENPFGVTSQRLIKLSPILFAGGLFSLDQWIGGRLAELPLETDLRTIQMVVEYVTAAAYVMASVAYIWGYHQKKNRFVIQAAAGLIVLIFAQAILITYGLPPELSAIAFGSFQAVGLMIFFVAMFRNNIDIPLAELVNAEKQIKLYAENLEKIVERRTSEIRQVNARFIREMDYARSIQQSLLPLKRLNFKKTVFYSEYYPCERLSGDFYDIYRIDDDHVGMYVLDVSGHGISAALMTMFCNNYIKSTERLIKRYRGLKPHRNLKHFYEEFNKMNFPEEMHMVIFFASYNLTTQMLTYSSGGMNCHPILVRHDGTWEYLDKSNGFPICRLSDFFEPEYTSEFIHLEDGDRLIFYTDGLIDKDKNSILDQDELVELMLRYREQPAKVMNRALTDRIDSVAAQLDDDVTYFIMDITA